MTYRLQTGAPIKHYIPSVLLNKTVTVAVIGAGGNGCNMSTGLAALDHALRALGHPGGLRVTIIDDDVVSAANVGRQPTYFESDIGLPKAVVLANRINQAYPDACFEARVERVIGDNGLLADTDIVIGCVDTVSSRRAIHDAIRRAGSVHYWLDLGNRLADGQVVLGEPRGYQADWYGRLPTIMDLNPQFLDPTYPEDDDTPSCSIEDALQKQSLFINRTVATFALSLLEELFRTGMLPEHGVFVSKRQASPLRIDKSTWARLGYKSRARALRRDLRGRSDLRRVE